MPPHSIGSATISFGLVSIPVRTFSATSSSASVSFNQLHEKCGSRIKQQTLCPVCNEVVERTALVKGFEIAKDQYVRFTNDELKALETEASRQIEITEFIPLDKVDPIYFESTYYLGPDKGGEKAYRLLSDAMKKTQRVALAQYVMRGKENLVLIRPAGEGLMLHTMYYADEVRDFSEIEKGGNANIKPGELELAGRLVDELSNKEFKPDKYRDEWRTRVMEAVDQKVEGKLITSVEHQETKTQVIDIMDALKQSLEQRRSDSDAGKREKKPAAKAKATAKAAPAAREKKVARR